MRALTGLLSLALIAAGLLALDWQRCSRTPLALAEPVRFELDSGTALRSVLQDWQRRGWLRVARDTDYLVAWARWRGLAGRIQAGEYAVRPGQTPLQVLDMLVRGDVAQHQFTIIEGWNIRQLRAALADSTVLAQELTPDADLMQLLGAPGTHPEGQFFPDTYRFPRGASDLDLLRRARAALRVELDRAWLERAPELPLPSAYAALTLASIIEKETSLREEMPRIAGVFTRRLRRGMRLQTDPTVIYGLGEAFDGDIRYRDLRRDTPYNTYTRHGLPPTPICMPGRDALAAAVNPQSGDALYFVARGDGSHTFSTTLEQHNAAVLQYQNQGRR